jgi:hypothetical protein
MPIQSSFPKVADQIVSFNKNIVDTLSKLNSLTTTTESSVNIQIYDNEGILRTYSLPSFTSLKAEIERLNNNINSLYNIDSTGSIIQSTSTNKYKKIITVDLNREPQSLDSLGNVLNFKSKVNWFFDSLLDPILQIELDLADKVENNVTKCLVRRYIIEFERDTNGNLTQQGLVALNSFNVNFKNNANILFDDFLNWNSTTAGVLSSDNPRYDEDTYDLEPNSLLYDGEFSIISIQEDRLNKKLWYVLNSLEYIEIATNSVKQLKIDDEVIINMPQTSSRYKVIEVSTAESNPRVRFERVEGLEPIPVGIGILKIYSPVIFTKKLRVNIGYNELNIIFIKPINTDTNLVAKKWSFGTGFYTNDLRHNSTDTSNGKTMQQFYKENVYDYGLVLKDLVAKKIPNKLGSIPNSPQLSTESFKIIQINKHLTDTTNKELINKKYNYLLTLKSEVKELEDSIIQKNKELKTKNYNSETSRRQAELQLIELNDKKESKSKLLASVNQEIIDLTNNTNNNIEPKFRLRGFWDIPTLNNNQQIVQFEIQYKYLSKDNRENPTDIYDINSDKAIFSNWVNYKTDVRKRILDQETGEYYWKIEDITNPDIVNINQLDIPIQNGEKVQLRIKSISEVGWPESPIESEWSNIITIDFPDELNIVKNENEVISLEANKENIKLELLSELESKGINEHLSDSFTVNNKIFYHDSNNISSNIKDQNGQLLSLFEYISTLERRIRTLEENISKTKGELQIALYKNNQEFIIDNGQELSFNIECEDYVEKFIYEGVPTGRVYENNIYVIKDFTLRIKNISTNTPLGLLSNRTYLVNSDIYNLNAPQVFWVNEQDELIKSDIINSQTRTQLNNQYIWSVNYDSVNDQFVSRLGENIGNNFNSNNSLTPYLSSTEYNIGFNEKNILSFIGNNNSLLESGKWIDNTSSVASTTKLLTTIHPVVKNLESITENNSSKVKTLNPGNRNDIIIPINIYFKLNSLDNNQKGLGYQYVDFNNSTTTVKHIKKVKFLLENESENRPFIFSIKFNINRNKVVFPKKTPIDNNIVINNIEQPSFGGGGGGILGGSEFERPLPQR